MGDAQAQAQGRAWSPEKFIGRSLAYLLRYAEEKEGLPADSRGFICEDALLPHFAESSVTREQLISVAERDAKRFQVEWRDGKAFLRAKLKHTAVDTKDHGTGTVASYESEHLPEAFLGRTVFPVTVYLSTGGSSSMPRALCTIEVPLDETCSVVRDLISARSGVLAFSFMFANKFPLTVDQERLCDMELMTSAVELPMGERGIFIRAPHAGDQEGAEPGHGEASGMVHLTILLEKKERGDAQKVGPIGRLEVPPETSMSQLRRRIRLEIGEFAPSSFAFLRDGIPLSKFQERDLRVGELSSDEVVCRGMSSVRSDLFSGENKPCRWTLFNNDEVTIDDQIGRGSFGTVFSGRLYGGSEVAIKRFDHDACVSERDRMEFVEEVRMMSALNHPNIVHFYGAGVDPLFIVMERCEQSLYSLLQERFPPQQPSRNLTLTGGGIWMVDASSSPGPPGQASNTFSAGSSSEGHYRCSQEDLEWALRLLLSVASGMHYLHEKSICHRDLKSLNILTKQATNVQLDVRQVPKISDFGLSRIQEDTTHSTFNKMRGTLLWMAPEVVRGDIYTSAIDVYSFGMLAWEVGNAIATGSYAAPFDEYGLESAAIMFRLGTRDFRPSFAPQFHPPLAALIERCWAGIPSRRPTFAQLVDEFQSLLLHPTSSSSSSSSSGASSSVGTESVAVGVDSTDFVVTEAEVEAVAADESEEVPRKGTEQDHLEREGEACQ